MEAFANNWIEISPGGIGEETRQEETIVAVGARRGSYEPRGPF